MAKDKLEQAFMIACKRGYDPNADDASEVKLAWKRAAKSYFEKLGKKANFDRFNVWFSAGGWAVSGDINLQGERNGKGIHLFGNIDCVGTDQPEFVIRSIKNLGDYRGGSNRWVKLEDMSVDKLMEIFDSYLKEAE